MGGTLAVLGADWAVDDIVTTLGVLTMGAVLLVASRRRPSPARLVDRAPRLKR